jgi:hypothetical protein
LLTLILQVLSIAGGLTGLVAFFLRYTNSADKVEQWVGEDHEYRTELADELCGSRLGSLYQHMLVTSLNWLDRRFGPAASSRALGFCIIIIALYYGYATFFLAWGVGGPGDLGAFQMLNESPVSPQRLPWAIAYVFLPIFAFFFGRWLGY